MRQLWILGLIICFGLLGILPVHEAMAIEEEQIVSSKKCDAAKIKEIGGKGVLKVEKSSWEGSYVVWINSDQISFTDLLQKLAKAGCN